MKSFQIVNKLSKGFICLMLIAVFSASASAQEDRYMIFGAMISPSLPQTNNTDAPTLTAEDISRRIIELIKTVKNKSDISPESIEQMMKIKVKFDEKNRQGYGFGGRIEGTRQWTYNLSAYSYPGREKQETDTLNFSFNPLTDDEKTPRDDYAPVCTVDFDGYSKELKDAGFSKSLPIYGVHSRLSGWHFERGETLINFSLNGGWEPYPQQCVKSILISIAR